MSSNAPPYSAMLWIDRGAIYCELACGLIQKYEKHELYKIIKLLEADTRPTERPSRTRMPVVPKRRRKPTEVTPEERDAATAILKRRGEI